jgi:hypothetical protein
MVKLTAPDGATLTVVKRPDRKRYQLLLGNDGGTEYEVIAVFASDDAADQFAKFFEATTTVRKDATQ